MLATSMPAIAGPMMRAPLNIEEFSAMAFIRSSLAHHVHDERLPRGNVEGVDHAQQGRQHEDVPHLHRAP